MRTTREQLETGEVAWLAAIPCALVTAGLALALGPPLGALLFPPVHARFFSGFFLHPKPAELARYLVSLSGPLLVSAAVVAFAGRAGRADRVPIALVRCVQLLLPVLLVAAFVRQHHPYYDFQFRHPYFSWAGAAFATLFALAIGCALSSRRAVSRAVATLRETSAKRCICLLAAVAYLVIWLLVAVNTDDSIGNAHYAVSGLIPWTADDAYAVRNGLTPLVDYHAQYGSLFPYASALLLSVFGSSLLTFTVSMAAASGLALLAIYDVLRRVARSSVAALALFGPFVAIGFSTLIGSHQNPFSGANDFSWFPLRIAGPYVLAWLVVRHRDGARPHRPWPIFVVGGLTALNNLEVGLAGLAAAVAALAWTRRRGDRRWWRTTPLELVAGLAIAYALVAVLTLARAGSLPHLGYLTEYSRLFVRDGLGLQAIPGFGFHWVLYATYAAALVAATVRAAGGERDSLTAMLAWSGVFGFGSAGYFVGEARYLHLVFLFSAWALALAMLLVATLRGVAARGMRRPTPADVALLMAFGLAVYALGQTPAPWTQLQRIASHTRHAGLVHSAEERFVAATARRGEHVAILFRMGHRIAEDLGLVNVAPYANEDLVDTSEQLEVVVHALRAAHGTRFYCWDNCQFPGLELQQEGFVVVRTDTQRALYELVDRSRPR